MPDNKDYTERNMDDALELLPHVNPNIFIRTTQFEIMKIVIDQFALKNGCQQWDDYSDYSFKIKLERLMKNKQIDIIKYLHYHFKDQNCFVDKDYFRQYVNLLIENQSERQFFSTIMDYESSNVMLPKKVLLFILLEKKKRKLFEKLIKLYPDLIHELDEDGNDPLLYICLKVSGLRHRIIESLIQMGSDLQRRNCQGQNFLDTLQLPRNKKLLQRLYEHEII
jgi:ankyrin repeat protein